MSVKRLLLLVAIGAPAPIATWLIAAFYVHPWWAAAWCALVSLALAVLIGDALGKASRRDDAGGQP